MEGWSLGRSSGLLSPTNSSKLSKGGLEMPKRRSPPPITREDLLRMEAINEQRRQRDYRLSRDYHARRKRQTPAWSDPRAIRAIYEEARRRSAIEETAYDVDHVLPLRSNWVSGLHVQC
jgi:hypothetical protein